MLQPASALGTPCGHSLPADTIDASVRSAIRTCAAAGRPASGYHFAPAVAARRARELRSALPCWMTLLYAVKANAFPPVVTALLADGGVDGLEIASAAEARLAASLLPAGRPLAAAGPAKHPALVAELIDAGASVIHVESTTELHRVGAAGRERGLRVPVALRVNPSHVDVAGTLAMGGRSTPFGIAEPAVPEALAVAQRLPGVEVVGFHMHAVSGNRDARAQVSYVDWVIGWSTRVASEHGVDLRWIDVGGGLGVSYDGSPGLDVDVLSEGLHALTPPAGVEVVLEPGRWLAADCGWYAAEVVDVKDSHDSTFVIVRGGIGGFALPATEDFPFPVAVLPVEDWAEPFARPGRTDVTVTVSGELCTPEDVLVRDVRMDQVRVGDVLVFPQAGAYGYEFALRDFLGHPAPTRATVLDEPVPAPAPVLA